MIEGTYTDCDVMTNILTALWIVVGVLIAGPFGYALGRRSMANQIIEDMDKRYGGTD